MDEQAASQPPVPDTDTAMVREAIRIIETEDPDATQDEIAEALGTKQPTVSRWKRELAEVDDPDHDRSEITPLSKKKRKAVRAFLARHRSPNNPTAKGADPPAAADPPWPGKPPADREQFR